MYDLLIYCLLRRVACIGSSVLWYAFQHLNPVLSKPTKRVKSDDAEEGVGRMAKLPGASARRPPQGPASTVALAQPNDRTGVCVLEGLGGRRLRFAQDGPASRGMLGPQRGSFSLCVVADVFVRDERPEAHRATRGFSLRLLLAGSHSVFPPCILPPPPLLFSSIPPHFFTFSASLGKSCALLWSSPIVSAT